MKSIEAVKILHRWDIEERYLFHSRELGLLFDEQGDKLRSTLRRLVKDEVLKRIERGVYLYGLSNHIDGDILYEIAAFLKLGEFSYESFESAASQWGIISQIPVARITVATTGTDSEVSTPYGVIEFTHVDYDYLTAFKGTISRKPYQSLPIASKTRTLEDMLTHKRTLELIDWEEVNDED